ncbi:MAG: hypothetical protein CBARDMAM_3929 [uncultured Caballeronia sp.]|nr:MAG: hypothetical protein CBARDMAM_3929 [uncultured Caballeronia sp.]
MRGFIRNSDRAKPYTCYMPYLGFDYGRTRIVDGRHRLYALIDLGYTHCPVVADSDHVAAIATLVRDEPYVLPASCSER